MCQALPLGLHRLHLKLPAVSKIDTMYSDYLEQINDVTEAHMVSVGAGQLGCNGQKQEVVNNSNVAAFININ